MKRDVLFSELKKEGYKISTIDKTYIVYAKKNDSELLFIDGYTPLVPYSVGLILSNKSFVRMILAQNNIPITKGKTFSPDELYKASLYAEDVGYPLMLRQENSQRNINSDFHITCLSDFKNKFKELSFYGECIIVEQELQGYMSCYVYIDRNGYINVLRKKTYLFNRSVSLTEKYDVVRQEVVLEDVTKKYSSLIKRIAKKILILFSPIPCLSFHILINERNDDIYVTEVYHSISRHYGHSAYAANKSKSILDYVIQLLKE